ncbi:serine/arginine repetitive matrix protein 1-like [Melozone crissalis]|uniref:serine/arginine repetitive matrix protein 1-like n=1 Tax=Melozone crissalis TaxID=40204 RepID=UPI0023DB6267|nr:serine/arginine repetitive matrix protein 1-like [Melozone crissalis]
MEERHPIPEAPPTPKAAHRPSESEEHRSERRESRASAIFGSRRQDARQSISELPEHKDEKRRLSCTLSESSLSADRKQPPPSQAAAGAQPSPAGSSLSPTGFGGRVKSASKLPPLPRKFSPAVYETFLEQSDAAAPGKVPGTGTAGEALRAGPGPAPTTLTSLSALRCPRQWMGPEASSPRRCHHPNPSVCHSSDLMPPPVCPHPCPECPCAQPAAGATALLDSHLLEQL